MREIEGAGAPGTGRGAAVEERGVEVEAPPEAALSVGEILTAETLAVDNVRLPLKRRMDGD